MANQYLNLGNVYLQRQELKKAEELFHKSLSIRKEVGGGWTGMSVAYNQLGVTYSLMGNDREAERMYGEAVRIEVANRQLSARTLFNHALAAFRNGEIDMAEAGLVMAQTLRNSDSRVTPEAKHVFANLILRQLVNNMALPVRSYI